MSAGETLKGVQTVHFVGIGGSGMSPLAEILNGQGYRVTGSDAGESDNIHRLERLGIPIARRHAAENAAGADLVVYTSAVPKDNPELLYAVSHGIPLIERGALLGEISLAYPRTVAVAGTHGKTTTTSMLAHILLRAGTDPSVFIGGRLPLIGANGRAGKSDIFVCEACEFQDHYLSMRPAIGLILNVDADHLDYFGSIDGVIASFHAFGERCSSLIVNADDPNTLRAAGGIQAPVTFCGRGENARWRAVNVAAQKGFHRFDALLDGSLFASVSLSVPGEHNVQNALMAIAAAQMCGVTARQVETYLPEFRGAGRRFEMLGTHRGVTVADDYAHHPTEITATLTAAREMGYRRIWAVFQPFTYSRTAAHLDAFAEALSLADTAVVCDIMGSREKNTFGVSSEQIVRRMSHGVYLPDFPAVTEYIVSHAEAGDLVITMGGGNIYYCARQIVQKLGE